MMPQGFKNSPAIFQRAMNCMFNDLINKNCVVYIDDILIFGETYDEHDMNLKLILDRLDEFGLKENRDKRIERKQEISFLGYEISLNQVRPTQTRIQGILDYKIPKTRKELQRFIGMINYDRLFVKGLSIELKPFYKLVQKDQKFIWGENETKIFNSVKSKWCGELNLRIPDMNKKFTLETDASDCGLGAVLIQENVPVAYLSRVLSKSEMKYGITEKETLAALWAMEKLKYYLMGNKFTLITDHKAIEHLKSKIEFGSSRIQRWFSRIEAFDFDISYRKGIEMSSSDALSRAFLLRIQDDDDISSKIKEYHNEFNHRKSIKSDLKSKRIFVSDEQIRKAIKNC
ncbi:Retrovirus-related Pol polyprotein from transposon 17.6 [Dictyocoela muelleri]|nr:Retrovirus-related Pol polyprotein from transposon 17.6 [Dictyocoela muelleri]